MKVAVIGGGPAGMIAAVECAKNGHSVTIYEKNNKLGKKLYITGKGRCNVTNFCDKQEFLQNIVSNPRFLFGAINKFSSADTMKYLEDLGVPLKIERGNRVFPTSDRAVDITAAFERAIKRLGVNVKFNSEITSVKKVSDEFEIAYSANSVERCDALVIATGGKSYPATGSTGDGYGFAEGFGHKVTKTVPALVPIKVKTIEGREASGLPSLEGLSLKNVEISFINGRKPIKINGEMLFTKDGISGPIVLTLSSLVNRTDISHAEIALDMKPALKEEVLDARLLRDFRTSPNKMLKNVLDGLLPSKIIPVYAELMGESSTKSVGQLSKEERRKLLLLFKNLRFGGLELYPIEYGIITAGGVNVNEINPSTMESKLISNLYFAGEVLDVDAKTGGFNIQIALSTGYVAGASIGGTK